MSDGQVVARSRENEKALLEQIRQDAVAKLWHLDRQAWTRKGTLTRCINATVTELTRLARSADAEDAPSGPVRLGECVALWSSTGLSWADTVSLVEIIQTHVQDYLQRTGPVGGPWLAQAALGSLLTEVAGAYLRTQAEEMARQRDDSVASRHLAGRFLANASHELRTPLTAVLGFSELLLEETYGPLSDEQRTAVAHIENSAQNLHEIVNNVLDLMQFRAGQLELQYHRVAPAPVLQNIYEILVPLSKRRKVRFRSEVPSDLGSMDADEGIIRHIVYHLLEIALRATPENGEVVLRAERTPDMLSIVAYDTALHLPQEAIETMNGAYPIRENSPTRGYDGWEIGLPLVRRYAVLHAGTLEVESSPDAGTTIRVHLPTRRPASGKQGLDARSAAPQD